MQSGKIGRHRSADHDVMEMRDHEVGIGHMDIDRDRREEQSGKTADRE